MTEPRELVNLVFSLVFFIILFKLFFKRDLVMPSMSIIVIGTILILLGNVFTVVEGYFFPVTFNLMEHLSFTSGTICFFVGSIKLYHSSGLADD